MRRHMSKTFHRVTRQTLPRAVQHGHQTRCLPVFARAPVLGIFDRLCWSSMLQEFFGLQVEMSFYASTFCLFHVFSASHESRFTVSKRGRSWKRALGARNFSDLGWVQTTQELAQRIRPIRGERVVGLWRGKGGGTCVGVLSSFISVMSSALLNRSDWLNVHYTLSHLDCK